MEREEAFLGSVANVRAIGINVNLTKCFRPQDGFHLFLSLSLDGMWKVTDAPNNTM